MFCILGESARNRCCQGRRLPFNSTLNVKWGLAKWLKKAEHSWEWYLPGRHESRARALIRPVGQTQVAGPPKTAGVRSRGGLTGSSSSALGGRRLMLGKAL